MIQANVDLKAEIAVREAAELALKGERVFTDNLIETANVLIIGLDETGAVQLFNPAAERATGYTKEELDGKNWFEVLVPKETYPDVWQMFEQISAEGVTVHFENPILTRGGEERIITWSNNPTGIGAKFAGTVSFGIDITERRQAEKAVLVYQDRLKALAAELTLSEERERRRIATHLHDEVGQALAFARIQIATARKAQSEQRRDSLLDDASQTLLESIRVTRNLVYDLSSPLLSELGLEAAISQWAETEIKERHNLDVQVFDDGHEKPLSEDVEALLFRNVRELLINVAKHAHATSVIVRVERVGDRVRISVQDDGQGMDADPTTQTVTGAGGFGLFSIQERMSDLGGSLEIISESGEGCTMILGAPLAIGQPSRECAT